MNRNFVTAMAMAMTHHAKRFFTALSHGNSAHGQTRTHKSRRSTFPAVQQKSELA
jgi:hypothetical protein